MALLHLLIVSGVYVRFFFYRVHSVLENRKPQAICHVINTKKAKKLHMLIYTFILFIYLVIRIYNSSNSNQIKLANSAVLKCQLCICILVHEQKNASARMFLLLYFLLLKRLFFLGAFKCRKYSANKMPQRVIFSGVFGHTFYRNAS